MDETIEMPFGPLNTSAEAFTGWLFQHVRHDLQQRILSPKPEEEMRIRPSIFNYARGSIGVEFRGRRWARGADPDQAPLKLVLSFTAIPLDAGRCMVRVTCRYPPLLFYLHELLVEIDRLYPEMGLGAAPSAPPAQRDTPPAQSGRPSSEEDIEARQQFESGVPREIVFQTWWAGVRKSHPARIERKDEAEIREMFRQQVVRAVRKNASKTHR